MKFALLAAAVVTGAFVNAAMIVGCDNHDDGHGHAADGGAHTSPYPACNEITAACHSVDVGEGPIHDCHDKGHAAKSEADCTPIKDRCLEICAAAKADGGGGGHALDGGQDGH
jgi:hypothetical protein